MENQGQRRGHFHRGRRGSDRRGIDRRSQPQPQERTARDQVDVEQIMREIRGRIAQRQGIDLSNQQIQDLAARRLESILDPRAIKPSLLDALRRSAGTPGPRAAEKVPNEPAFSFEDTTIYDSHRGLMRFMRRLLNPILKLFFNPNPLIRALHIQGKLNVEAAERDAERDRRQTEWNALHYEIVQRLVTEVSRASLELQALSLRVESLDAKVDFNERRVRGIEGSVHRTRPQAGPTRPATEQASIGSPAVEIETVAAEVSPAQAEALTSSDSARRRRRRRRGRRSGTGGEPLQAVGMARSETATSADGERTPVATQAEQVPDTGIYEAAPVPAAAEPPAISGGEAPAQTPVEQAPATVPSAPASIAADERTIPELPADPTDIDRREY